MDEIKDTVVNETTPQAQTETAPTIDYQAEYEKSQAELKKLKAVADKNASEAADYKKKWRATLDENQQASMAKEEAEKAMREELEMLRKERDLTNAEKSYLSAGYPQDLATRMAQATYENNTAEMIAVQKSVIEQMKKTMLAELTNNMSISPISNGEHVVTKKEFDNMSLQERNDLYIKNKALYESLAK